MSIMHIIKSIMFFSRKLFCLFACLFNKDTFNAVKMSEYIMKYNEKNFNFVPVVKFR